jgi:hydroxymethylglutaryl-CoA reductase (NADPH)
MSEQGKRTLELPALLQAGNTVLQADAARYEEPSRKNVESFVGCARVPVGLAGPLEIRGEHAQGRVFVPMATTEGTLVASTTRGMKVLNESGGVKVRVTRRGGIQRAPVLFFADVEAALACARALEQDWRWLAPLAEKSTKHGKLTDVRVLQQGRAVHVRLTMDPGDAAGQNMVSVAASHVVELRAPGRPTWSRSSRPT